MKTSRLPSSPAAATSGSSPASSFILLPSSFPPSPSAAPRRHLRLLASFSFSAFQLFSFSAVAAAAPAPTPVSSTISAATVYTDRAVITRTAHLELPTGQTELTFDKLPANLIEASLQVTGHGPANATILDVGSRLTYSPDTVDPQEKASEDAIEDLRQQDRALTDKRRLLDRQRALLTQIETLATKPAPAVPAALAKDAPPPAPPPTFDDWQKLLTFSADKTADFAQAQRDLSDERDRLAARLATATAQLSDLRGQRPGAKSSATVTVRLTAAAAGALDLALTYAVPDASWSPVYDARLRSDTRVIELAYFGLVHNATGEDWKNIALTLSTARPGLGGGIPEPAPWVLEVARPVMANRDRRDGMNNYGGTIGSVTIGNGVTKTGASTWTLAGSNAYTGVVNAINTGSVALEQNAARPNAVLPFGADGSTLAEPSGDLAYQSAGLASGATSATFKILAPATLPGDNSPQRVAITALKLPALLQYQAMPRATETVYLTAYALNGPDFPLLAGALNAFLDDNFIATSRLPTVMPAERFHLALGADEGISLKRKVIQRYNEDNGGFFTSKTHVITYEFEFTVTNHKKNTDPERVMFKDVLPVSRDERIVVKLLTPVAGDLLKPETIAVAGALPKAGITQEEDGKLVWRLDVKPGETIKRTFKFTVEYPNDLPVGGLQ